MPHFHAFCFPRLVIVAFLQIPIDRGRRGYLYVNSKLHAVDFYGKWILSDEQQIGPRLEKEIEMYCSKRGFRKLKDIVLLRDLHREERHIAQVLGFLHHLLTRHGNIRDPQYLWNIHYFYFLICH